MVAMTFLISTLVSKATSATGVGFLVFILGYFVQIGAVIVFGIDAAKYIRVLFSLFSPSMLVVLYYLL